MDLTTILTIGSLFIGLVLGDAAFVGSSLYVSMTIPKQLEDSGFSKATAEGIFVTEVNRYISLGSLIPTPSVTTSSSPDLPTAIARPLQLDGVVYALQAQIHEYGVVNVTASLVMDGKGPGLQLYTVVNNPPDPPAAITMSRPDGNPGPLIKAAARSVMIAIAPYMVAKNDFEEGIEGDPQGFIRSSETIAAGLAQPWDPRPEGATETLLLYNLRALLAMHDGDLPGAERDFARSKTVPGAFPAAYALIAMNQAFLAVTNKQPEKAALFFQEGASMGPWQSRLSIAARIKVLEGLIAWSWGDTGLAESDFRAAIATINDDAMPHLYLAQIMEARGDTAAAVAERSAAVEARRYDPKFPPLAQADFLADPVKGGFHAIRQ